MIGCLWTRVHKQPIISLYFDFDTVLKFYSLEAWRPFCGTCNSYTMGYPSVLGDNPRALASGFSYVQVDKHVIPISYNLYQLEEHVIPILYNLYQVDIQVIPILYNLYQCRPFDHREIFRVKVG